MALSALTKPSPSRALLLARLHHASPASMGTVCFSAGSEGLLKFSTTVVGFIGTPRASSSRHGFVSSSENVRHRCFCSSSWPINGPQQRSTEKAGPVNISYTQQGVNASSGTYPYQQQPISHSASNYPTHLQQQQQPTCSENSNNGQQPAFSTGNQHLQQPTHAPHMGVPPAGICNQNLQRPGHAPTVGASSEAKVGSSGVPATSDVSGNQITQQPGYTTPNAPSTGPVASATTSPRTSAAAEVIDKYLGPSTLKLEKRDDKAPPPPPPPRRNYGPQGSNEKKSGKDLVAESAACAVIEKYLGPWPGFPPRDPKIDEYLDSLPENAACAAIDKYFGPYKPLFVFKKKEGEVNNPPPPSRPPRSRMMSRARNRAWNASQQGASVDRPWMAPQQGSSMDATQGVQSQSAGVPPSSIPTSSQQPVDTMPSQPGAVPPRPSMTPTQVTPQQGASAMPSSCGANVEPPHGAGFSPPRNNSS